MGNNSLFKNVLLNFVKNVVNMTFPIITFAYASRLLGQDGIGKVYFIKNYVTYFTLLALFGTNLYGTREGAKLKNDRDKLVVFANEIFRINVFTVFASYVFYFILYFTASKLSAYRVILFIFSFAIAIQGLSMEWVYQAFEDYSYITRKVIFIQFISMLLVLVSVRSKKDIIPYAIITAISNYGPFLFNFFIGKKYLSFVRVPVSSLKKHITPLLFFFFYALSIQLYVVMDSTMLGFMTSDDIVGRYAVAIKVNRIIKDVITSTGIVLIPRLSVYLKKGNDDLALELVDKAYNFVFLFSIPACFGLFELSKEIIGLFAGEGFTSASVTMQILTLIVFIIPISSVTNNQILIPFGKEKLIIISTTCGAVTNLILNSVLIPV